MNSNYLEHFKQIQNILKNKQEPVNIIQLSKKLSLSIPESRVVLNLFSTQGNIFNDYIVIFSAEIIEEDKIKTIILPSFSTKLADIIDYDSYKLLNFGVFAICRKESNFLLKDFSVFCYENDIIENIKMIKVSKKEHKPSTSSLPLTLKNSNQSNGDNSNFQNKINQSNNTISNVKHIDKNNNNSASVTSNSNAVISNGNKNNPKADSSLLKAFNNKVNLNENDSKINIKNEPSHNKPEIKSQIEDLTANYIVIDQDEKEEVNPINHPIPNNDLVFNSNEECYYDGSASIFAKSTTQVNKMNNKTDKNNIIINYVPKQAKKDENFANQKLNESNSLSLELKVPEKRKRANSEDESLNNKIYTKKKNEPDSIQGKGHNIINDHIQENDEFTQLDQIKEGENCAKKVKKIRKVKKTNTYVDEKGYLHTRDEWVDEEYWSDEKKKPISNQASLIDNKNKKPGNKKVAAGQSSLHSFFGR